MGTDVQTLAAGGCEWALVSRQVCRPWRQFGEESMPDRVAQVMLGLWYCLLTNVSRDCWQACCGPATAMLATATGCDK